MMFVQAVTCVFICQHVSIMRRMCDCDRTPAPITTQRPEFEWTYEEENDVPVTTDPITTAIFSTGKVPDLMETDLSFSESLSAELNKENSSETDLSFLESQSLEVNKENSSLALTNDTLDINISTTEAWNISTSTSSMRTTPAIVGTETSSPSTVSGVVIPTMTYVLVTQPASETTVATTHTTEKEIETSTSSSSSSSTSTRRTTTTEVASTTTEIEEVSTKTTKQTEPTTSTPRSTTARYTTENREQTTSAVNSTAAVTIQTTVTATLPTTPASVSPSSSSASLMHNFMYVFCFTIIFCL